MFVLSTVIAVHYAKQTQLIQLCSTYFSVFPTIVHLFVVSVCSCGTWLQRIIQGANRNFNTPPLHCHCQMPAEALHPNIASPLTLILFLLDVSACSPVHSKYVSSGKSKGKEE